MSLDELLKKSDKTSGWSSQKKKLLRIIFGISIITISLIIGIILLFSIKENKLKNNLTKQEEAKNLANLMKLQDEAKDLEKEIENLKKQALASKKRSNTIKSNKADKKAYPAKIVPSNSSSIISYDPGEAFTNLDTRTREEYIPTGSVFQAQLITPIKTSIAKTFILAKTIREYRMDLKRKIPKGSKLIGTSRLNPILKGVIVEFNTLVLPNGIETRISGLALSRNALPEIEGLYFSDKLQNYGAALAFGFLSGFTDAARTRETTIIGSQTEQTLRNHLFSGISSASFQIAEDILRDIRSKAIEYVVIPAGKPVFVALTSRYVINQRSEK